MVMSFEEIVKDAGFKLAELKEVFIIQEMTPYLENDTLKQLLRVRLTEIEDYKWKVKLALNKFDEEFKDSDPLTKIMFDGASKRLRKELEL